MPSPWFGLFLPQMRMSYDTILARTRLAEELGFDSVWLMDHLAPPALPQHDAFEGWTLATALAMQTTRIRVGHMVLCDAFRPPAVLAKMVATLDVLSGGRLDLGIGWGSVPEELTTYGLGRRSPAERAARLDETLQILRLMFSGEPFDFDGTYYTLRGAVGRPTPVQQPLPIHIGGAGELLTMPLVRAHADWWNCPSYGIERLADLLPAAGSARVSAQHPIALVTDDTRREETLAVAERRFGSWGGLVAGTPDDVAAVLASEVVAGVEGFVLQFTDFGQPETLTTFMTQVAPAVRGS